LYHNLHGFQSYLQRYGYLPGSDIETGALRTEEEVQRAVREFQHYYGIKATGELDQLTLEAMGRERCGVVDVLPSHQHHFSKHNSRKDHDRYNR